MLRQRGVTLIELIIGMVVLGIAITLITSSLLPLALNNTDPWHQVRAAELGQSLMNEILAKRYDENSPSTQLRCGETGAPACSSSLGPESGETRDSYDDVDDYNGLVLTGTDIANILNESLNSIYSQYRVSVTVVYDGNALGLSPDEAKRIDVTVTTPGGSATVFSAYKGNW
ncbi:type IV pilus modification PilV family protein [Gallaecimonas mangrovi]|uniref:type IV pilus modification PilV family protein n=1 Tax=Gallaecimonas mangrovi TaxID=2291597 RepID=UPI000E20AB95|nr:prepilin-type N-terminal cleavage/methylation domain-containing protein [Gallaecimonas mangrovi]